MTDFAALLDDLETLQKASAPSKEEESKGDDKKIAAAAGADCDKDDDKDDKGEEFGKAFKVTLADGTEAEAFDGTAMLKALHTEHTKLAEVVEAQRADMQKAMEILVAVAKDQRKTIADQSDLLKALGSKVAVTSGQGTGRRAMVSIAEKLSIGSEGPAKPSAQQVMMKAQQMCRNNQLGWEALPRIEAFQGRGQIAPPDLLARFPELLTPAA